MARAKEVDGRTFLSALDFRNVPNKEATEFFIFYICPCKDLKEERKLANHLILLFL